jgi:hypothetical protein
VHLVDRIGLVPLEHQRDLERRRIALRREINQNSPHWFGTTV